MRLCISLGHEGHSQANRRMWLFFREDKMLLRPGTPEAPMPGELHSTSPRR